MQNQQRQKLLDDKAADAEPAKIDAPTDKSDTKTKDKGEDI